MGRSKALCKVQQDVFETLKMAGRSKLLERLNIITVMGMMVVMVMMVVTMIVMIMVVMMMVVMMMVVMIIMMLAGTTEH